MSAVKNRIFIRISLGIVALALITGAAAAYFVPWLELRSNLVKLYANTPYMVVRLDLRQALRDHDFPKALELLKRQKEVAEAIGFTNFMKHDLVESTGLAVTRSLATGEQHLFSSWLEELRDIVADDYRGLALLALSLAEADPKKARELANQALTILPVDEIPYRTILISDLEQRKFSDLPSLCNRYKTAQLGAFDAATNSDMTFAGQGIRTLSLAIEKTNGSHYYATSQGIKLGDWGTSLFDFTDGNEVSSLRLILPVIAGLKITIDQISLHTPQGIKTLAPNDLIIATTYGYVLSQREFLIPSHKGETLMIHLPIGNFPEFSQVEIRYKADRLPMVNTSACTGN